MACANGRIEIERVSITAKYAGRLAEVRVSEGNSVEKHTVLARLDTSEILAQLAAAKAALHRAHQGVARAEVDVVLREAELKLAEAELRRSVELSRTQATPQAEVERRAALRDFS